MYIHLFTFNKYLTAGRILVLQIRPASLLCLHKEYGIAVIRVHGKPWFFHGYSTLCKPLWGNEGWSLWPERPSWILVVLVVYSLFSTVWLRPKLHCRALSGFGRECNFCFVYITVFKVKEQAVKPSYVNFQYGRDLLLLNWI